eukprot:scaffold3340_cov114-Isochrysis_galbana.AAC.1
MGYPTDVQRTHASFSCPVADQRSAPINGADALETSQRARTRPSPNTALTRCSQSRSAPRPFPCGAPLPFFCGCFR